MNYQECINCGKRFNKSETVYTCDKCGGLLDIIYDYSEIEIEKKAPPRVWKYGDLLPTERAPISLQEGGTPLYKTEILAKSIGIKNLLVKHEGMNPSGSFKDRGMTVGVTKALELRMNTVACASTGNTAASLAMYAARAGIEALVLLPPRVALGKVTQALMHGAKVVTIKGNFDESLRIIRKLCDEKGWYLLNSVNPFRLEGQKTIAFEIADQMGWNVPNSVIVPVGNAGNISAIYKGFVELEKLGLTDDIPKLVGIQAEHASPVVDAFESGEELKPVSNPKTIATAIRIGDPVNAVKALKAIHQSRGVVEKVSDNEIVGAQKELAREGIGVEPASAASIAGLKKLREDGLDLGEDVVCIATGHLLKDPDEILEVCGRPIPLEELRLA